MRKSVLLTLCCVLFLCDQILADDDNEMKRGVYPYMAFLYYPEESVVEPSGARFIRGAVLVKPDWLITSSVGPITINDRPLGFPRKTLLARLGAITIDYKFTLSEDEDEQEGEVIQIVRPYNQSATQWWRTDITLLKTLLPFNMSATVGLGTLRMKPSVNITDCFVLIYSRRISNWTAERQLMQYFVEIMPPSSQKCGIHYYAETMLCAIDNEEYKSKSLVNDSEFCQGNSGGPLVCDNEITGIQTYIDNNCKQPHLYQDLAAWENFITCGIEDKCNEEQCSNMCTVINKDDDTFKYETTTDDPPTTTDTTLFTLTEAITLLSPSSESLRYDDEFVVTASSTAATQTTVELTTEKMTTTTLVTTKSEPVTEQTVQTSWPKEKLVESEDKVQRTTSVEAQRQDVKVKVHKNNAPRNICYFQSLFSVFVFVCLM